MPPKYRYNFVVPESDELFPYSAYDSALVWWSDFNGDEPFLPTLGDYDWEVSSNLPEKETTRTIYTLRGFEESLGDIFWAIFKSERASEDNWVSYPEEISDSAIIKCKLIKHIHIVKDIAMWIQVEIQEVITLPNLVSTLKTNYSYPEFTAKQFRSPDIIRKFEDWLLISYIGDIGEYAVINYLEEQPYLIALGEWGINSSAIHFGRVWQDINILDKYLQNFLHKYQ